MIELRDADAAEEPQAADAPLALLQLRVAQRRAGLQRDLAPDRLGAGLLVADDQDVLDEHLGAFLHHKRDVGGGPVGQEGHARVHDGRRVPAVEQHQRHAVAVHGDLLLVVRPAGGRGDGRAQRGLGHRGLARHGNRADQRARPFVDREADLDGHRRGRAGRRRRHRRHRGLRVAAAAVLLGDGGRVGGHRAFQEQLAFARAQQPADLGFRHRRRALDQDAPGAELRAARDGEDHRQAVVAGRALVVGAGVAIALCAQMLADAVGRVLQQVLVHRPLALDRHQLAAQPRRQRIALEDDRDQGAAVDVDEQRRLAGARTRPQLVIRPRLVVPLLAEVAHQPLELPVHIRLPVQLAGLEVEPLGNRRQRDRRVAFDGHARQAQPRPGRDVDHQDAGLARIDDVGPGRDDGLRVARVAQDLEQKRREVVEPRQGERRPEAVRDAVAQHPLGHARLAAEGDAAHRARGHEGVDHRHAAVGPAGGRHHVVEPAQPHEVRDRLAHGGGRQRLADARLHQVEQHRVHDGPRVDDDGLRHQRAAQRRRHRVGLRGGGRGRRRDRQPHGQRPARAGPRRPRDGRARAPPLHQNTYLTRTSSAYVRSSFCDSTHDSRSFWSYSSRITWSRVVDDADRACEKVR